VNADRPDEQAKPSWKPDDPRLLRAARRLIRLYDLQHTSLFTVSPNSVANVIAQELNQEPKQGDS
jgi:hypothetical protein